MPVVVTTADASCLGAEELLGPTACGVAAAGSWQGWEHADDHRHGVRCTRGTSKVYFGSKAVTMYVSWSNTKIEGQGAQTDQG